MMENMNNQAKKQLILFVALSILLGWGIFMIIPLKGWAYGEGATGLVLTAMMFAPTISSLLTRLITREGFKNMYINLNLKGNLKKYLLVFFGPSILLIISSIVYFAIFPGNFDSQLLKIKEIIEINGPEGMTESTMLLVMLVQIILMGPIINIIPTLGEEIGWRGYLLPKLRVFLPDQAALLSSGAIWGIWHLPAIVMGHNYGTDYIGYPWLGVLAMLVFCIVLGIIEGYATIKLDSIIPAAMIHSTINAGAALPIVLAKEGYNTLIGPAITGLVGGIPFIILAIIIFFKVGKEELGGA